MVRMSRERAAAAALHHARRAARPAKERSSEEDSFYTGQLRERPRVTAACRRDTCAGGASRRKRPSRQAKATRSSTARTAMQRHEVPLARRTRRPRGARGPTRNGCERLARPPTGRSSSAGSLDASAALPSPIVPFVSNFAPMCTRPFDRRETLAMMLAARTGWTWESSGCGQWRLAPWTKKPGRTSRVVAGSRAERVGGQSG